MLICSFIFIYIYRRVFINNSTLTFFKQRRYAMHTGRPNRPFTFEVQGVYEREEGEERHGWQGPGIYFGPNFIFVTAQKFHWKDCVAQGLISSNGFGPPVDLQGILKIDPTVDTSRRVIPLVHVDGEFSILRPFRTPREGQSGYTWHKFGNEIKQPGGKLPLIQPLYLVLVWSHGRARIDRYELRRSDMPTDDQDATVHIECENIWMTSRSCPLLTNVNDQMLDMPYGLVRNMATFAVGAYNQLRED